MPLKPCFRCHSFPRSNRARLLLALLYGALITLAFVLWPLGRAHDVAVAALFRDMIEPSSTLPRRRYMVLTVIAIAALAGLAIGVAEDRKIALIYVVASAAVFVVLRLLAAAIMAVSRRVPRPRSTTLRLALSNIYRPGALTPSVVLSLGLGLSLLVTLALIEGNLRRQLTSTLPKQAPSFFFLDVASAEAERFNAFVRDHSPADARLDEVPMLRGRIVSLKGVPVEDIKPDPEAAWVLQSDRGITFAEDVPEGSAIVEGAWWPNDYDGPPVVSFEKRIADLLKLKVGDPIVVNVLGRNVEATIANLRRVDWENLGINFVMLFPPNTFHGAPYNLLATLTYADGGKPDTELKLIKEIARAFPAVTTVRVKEALDAINSIVGDLSVAVRAAAGITLIASILVLAGALAAGHHTRVYDAVILKTLGATRGRLVLAYGIEYAILGLITAVIATAAGAAAGAYVVKEVMHFRFVFTPSAALIAAGVVGLLYGRLRAYRHLAGARPETGLGIEEFVILGLRKRVFHRSRNLSGNSLAALIHGPHIDAPEFDHETPITTGPAVNGSLEGKEVIMSDYNTNPANRIGTPATRAGVAVDQGLRAYMLRVYNYMALGLAITGVAAWFIFTQSVTADPALAVARVGNIMLTDLGRTLFVSPLKWLVIFRAVRVRAVAELRHQSAQRLDGANPVLGLRRDRRHFACHDLHGLYAHQHRAAYSSSRRHRSVASASTAIRRSAICPHWDRFCSWGCLASSSHRSSTSGSLPR